jgi:hypothetical protein
MIKVLDDFFEKKDLEYFQYFAKNSAFYTPCYFDDAPEKSKKYYYGSRFFLRNEPKLLKMFKKQSELKFKIKIKKIHLNSGIDIRNYDHFKPHIDFPSPQSINILLMLSGPIAVTNGTVFYYGDMTKCDLDMHVGFRENRAILFPSNKVHSQHAIKVPNLKRYTSTLFVENYEEV